ncbi:MAG: DUF4838 domain-containing protein [Clostridia bacterium]|nr:DUF4838 domain-containing protein [Clostridia bacterium]
MRISILADCGTYDSVQSAACSENTVDWWDDGDEKQIYCTECHAATEILKHLDKSGYDTVFASIIDSNSAALVIIGKEMIVKCGFSAKKAGKDGSYECIKKGNQIFILIWGNDRYGTLNAAHMWLYSLGFRWYTPDEDISYIPQKPEFPEGRCDLSFDYETRACYNEFIDDENPGFLKWASRNCMNMLRVNKFKNPHLVKKLGLSIMGGGHEIFYRYLNPNAPFADGKTHFKAHPEWFALIDGKRSSRDENIRATEGYYTGDNICTSNPDAVAELAKNMLDSFKEGDYRHLDYLNLWAYDNGTWCSCDECRALGNLSRRMLMLGYDINKHFVKAYKEHKIGRRIRLVVPVYHETLEPPDMPLPDDFDYEYIIATYFPIERCYAHNINDLKCTETNLRLMKLYEKWTDREKGNYKGDIFIGEYYNVSSFASLPFMFAGTMENDIPYYHRTGTRHLYYMHISARKWGMLALNNNILAGLMRDISFDVEGWMNEFYSRYYPRTGKLVREFHIMLEFASANAKYLKHYQFAGDGSILSLIGEVSKPEKFPLLHCKFNDKVDDENASISFTATMGKFKEAETIIKRILMEAQGIEKERAEIEYMRFDYGHKVMEFIFTYTKLRMAYDEKDTDAMEGLFDKLDELRNELMSITEPLGEMKYECPWYANAYKATWHADGYDKLRAGRKTL